MTSRPRLTLLLVVVGIVSTAATSRAQRPPEPIGPFVADVRLSFPFYPHDAEIAGLVGQPASLLPSSGLGLTLGGHWYPLRWRAITFGVGGELILSRGKQGPSDEDLAAATSELPTVETRLTAFSPQISFNFGSRAGWSYISGGFGNAKLTIRPEGVAATGSEPSASTYNYGGGARWFNTEHLAFTLDMRIFAMNPIVNEAGGVVLPRTTVVVLNVGIAFK